MTFRGPGGVTVPVWLPRRSLLVMRGAARYCWSHGITPRHYDTLPGRELGLQLEGLTLIDRDVRVSLTFRSVEVERLYIFVQILLYSGKHSMESAAVTSRSSVTETNPRAPGRRRLGRA